MYFESPITAIFSTYEVAIDALRVTARAIERQDGDLVVTTGFSGTSPSESSNALQSARDQIEDLAVLAMWAAFERYIIEQIQNRQSRLATTHPPEFARSLAKKFAQSVERWPVGEILDLFKKEVGDDLLRSTQAIKKYRDWVAHRNPKKAPPPRTDPSHTFDVLSSVVAKIHEAHTVTQAWGD